MVWKSAKSAKARAEMVKWLFDNSRDLMQVIAPDGTLLQVNKAWSDFTGLTESELVGRKIGEFCHPEEIQSIKDRAAYSRPGDLSETEVRIRAADGSWHWVAARRQVMEDGCHIGNMRDISVERARRDEVEEANRTRKMLGTSAGVGTWSFEPLEDSIWWSDELRQLIGLDASAHFSADAFLALVHPKDRVSTRALMARSVASGEPAQMEHRVWANDRWLAMRATVTAEPRGKGIFALKGISEDITELAAARDAARAGEQLARKARLEVQATARRLDMALSAAEAGAYEVDHVNRTFWCSPEFARITGCSSATYEQVNALSHPNFHPDDLPFVRNSFRALNRRQAMPGESFEARIIRPDGTERWVRVFHSLATRRNGRWLKSAGLVQDCDAAKRQELALIEAQRAAEAGAEAKTAFLANMSHEIRTPLNGVMGVLHILKQESLSDEGRSLLAEAISCGQMLAELLNDVIDFSKIEAGRLELMEEPVDPAALAASVSLLLEPQARAKGLVLTVEAEPDLGWVQSDPVRLRQALFNLVGNAVKFTDQGHVTVRCRRNSGDMLRFEVEDTGVGISTEVQTRLFQRFNQADASTTRRFGGSGLGLAITRRLAEMMDGQVGLTSIEGIGSHFWFEVRAAATASPVVKPEVALGLLDGLQVLVVEDNATNRLIATRLLEHLGAEVSTAVDGYEGVDAAASRPFDLILMDIQMPGIDGLEALRRIRALGGETAQTPIVALTANVLSHQRQAYLDAGMDGVVGKPISPGDLLREIGQASAARAQRMSDATAAA